MYKPSPASYTDPFNWKYVVISPSLSGRIGFVPFCFSTQATTTTVLIQCFTLGPVCVCKNTICGFLQYNPLKVFL